MLIRTELYLACTFPEMLHTPYKFWELHQVELTQVTPSEYAPTVEHLFIITHKCRGVYHLQTGVLNSWKRYSAYM